MLFALLVFSLGNSPIEAKENLSFEREPGKESKCSLEEQEGLMHTEDDSKNISLRL